jgi:D-psicose/D-tagatose/L-ribulose 3-epimerase
MTGSPALSFCNELLAYEGLSLAEQAGFCAEIGYQGLEIAPETLGDKPHKIGEAQASRLRATVEGEGLRVTGLHWLLKPYPVLSITTRDAGLLASAQETLIALLDLCANLGGSVMVHGSPGQRQLEVGETSEAALPRVAEFFRPVAEAAGERGIVYCIEPLSRAETRFLNTVDEAERLVAKVGHDAFQTMIDTSAAGQTETVPVAKLLQDKLKSAPIGHIQLNDTNRGAPGTGNDPFDDILKAIRESDWQRPIAVEPFKLIGDAKSTAAYAAATIKALWGCSK